MLSPSEAFEDSSETSLHNPLAGTHTPILSQLRWEDDLCWNVRNEVSVCLVNAPRVADMPDNDIAIFAGRLTRVLSDQVSLQNGRQRIEEPLDLCGGRSNLRVVYGLGYEVFVSGVDQRLDDLVAAWLRTERERRLRHVIVGFSRPGVFEGHLALHGCEGWIECTKYNIESCQRLRCICIVVPRASDNAFCVLRHLNWPE